MVCHLAAIAGAAILVSCHIVKSLQLILRLVTRRWNLRIYRCLIVRWEAMTWLQIGHKDCSPSDGHQGDMPLLGIEPLHISKCYNCNSNMLVNMIRSLKFGRLISSSAAEMPATSLINQKTQNQNSSLTINSWAPSQYKDRLIYVWRFPC